MLGQAIITGVLSALFGVALALVMAHILWTRAYPERPRKRFLILSLICFGIVVVSCGVIAVVSTL